LSVPASPTLRWVTAGLLLVAAVLCLALPFVSATLLTIALGGVAIAAGISQLLRLTSADDTRSKVFRAISGVLYVVGGIGLVAFPVASTVSLTLFIGVLLAVEGVMELAGAAHEAASWTTPVRRVRSPGEPDWPPPGGSWFGCSC